MRLHWMIAVVATCLLVTVAAVAYAPAKASAGVPVQEVVRAHRFDLVDSRGEVQAVLGCPPNVGPGLSLCDEHGKPRVNLMLGPDGSPALTLWDKQGEIRAALALDASGTPSLILSDKQGKLRAALGLGLPPDGGPGFALFDEHGDVIWSATREAQAEATPERVGSVWKTLASWSGKGPKSTQKFTVTAPWKIAWTTEPRDRTDGVFSVFIYGEDGMPRVAANVMGADSDESIQHTPGTYHLEINATQPYTITVLERR